MRRILIALVILAIALFLFYVFINQKESSDKLVQLNCNGVIDSVRQSNNHGTYYFLIDGKWEYFDVYGDYVNHFAIPGDSLVKKKGEDEIFIYKQNSDFKFEEYKRIALSVYPLQSLDK